MTKDTKPSFSFALMPEGKIDAAIVSIGKRSASLQMDVHKAAVATLAAWQATGDYRPAVDRINRLIAAFNKGGMRSNALVDWAVAFGGFVYNEQTKLLVHGKDKAGKHIDLQAAMNEPFWLFKPQSEYKPFVLLDQLLSNLKKADSVLAKPKKGDDVDTKLMMALRKVVADHKAGVL